jgi:hypothetical protein
VDLVGGYYDAGDNVKFGLPMAFTVTMMSWSVLEYGNQMAAAGELGHAVEAIKWGTDYLVKAHPEPNVLYGEVCWLAPLHPAAPPGCHALLPLSTLRLIPLSPSHLHPACMHAHCTSRWV